MPLSAEDAHQIARFFLEAHDSLRQYRRAHLNELSEAERNDILAAAMAMFAASVQFSDQAIDLAIADIEGSAGSLRRCVEDAKSAVRDIQAVKDALAIAAAFVSIGGGVASGDLKGISAGAVSLVKAIKAARNGGGDKAGDA